MSRDTIDYLKAEAGADMDKLERINAQIKTNVIANDSLIAEKEYIEARIKGFMDAVKILTSSVYEEEEESDGDEASRP